MTSINRNGSLHDSQRKKVYRAEDVVFKFFANGGKQVGGTGVVNKHTQEFETIGDCKDWLMPIIDRKTFQRWYPRSAPYLWTNLVIRPGHGARRAFASGRGTITLPRWARNRAVMLHELSHLVVSLEYRRSECAFHGWQFCQVYLNLVRSVMGQDIHDALKAQFKKDRVKFTPPRAKRKMTEEQKQVLRDRLVVARAAKQKA